MRKLGLSTLTLAMIASGSHAWGHPGHGVTPELNGIFHYLAEPLHVLPWIALAAAAYWVVRRLQSAPGTERS